MGSILVRNRGIITTFIGVYTEGATLTLKSLPAYIPATCRITHSLLNHSLLTDECYQVNQWC